MGRTGVVVLRTLLLLAVAISLVIADPALAAKKKKKKLAPGDIAYSRSEKSKEFPPAIFQHWRHVSQFRCYVCHDALFEMQQSKGLGEKMHEGTMCGSCHDGKPAFALGISTCSRCHIAIIPGDDKKKKKKKKKKVSKQKEKVKKEDAE